MKRSSIVRTKRSGQRRAKGTRPRSEDRQQVQSSNERASPDGLTRSQLDKQLASDRCEVDVVHLPSVRAALAALPGETRVAQVADLLSLLANPTRLRMLLALQPAVVAPRPELCVCDLATVIGASKSLTSHQLRLLRASGVVRQRRAGKLAYYQLAEGPLVSILAALADLVRGHEQSDLEPLGESGQRTATGR